MQLSSIYEILGLDFLGSDLTLTSLNTLENAASDQLAFVENERYLKLLPDTRAGAILIAEKYAGQVPDTVHSIIVPQPQLAMAILSAHFARELPPSPPPVIHPSASIHPSAVISNGCVIGADVIIHPNVTLYAHSHIGDRTILHAGCVIGGDGFGYAHTAEGEHIKIHHFGRCILEEDVEIGANTTVDRAVFGETRIRRGTKIDNLVQIAHNCDVGEYSIIVSQAGISGSTKLGRNVIMGGQSAIAGHIEVGDFATIAARGGVSKSIEGGKTYSGFPLMEHRQWLRFQGKLSKLMKP